MPKIEKLTPEQEARLPEFRAEWFAVGSSDKRMDRAALPVLFRRVYATIDRPAPLVVPVDGPIAASVLVHLWPLLGEKLSAALSQSLAASLGDSLGDSLYDSLGDSLGESLDTSLGTSLGTSLADSLGTSLRTSLSRSLYDSLVASLGTSLHDSLDDALHDSVSRSLSAKLYDSLDASLRASLSASLGESLGNALAGSLSASLGESLGNALAGSLYRSLDASLYDSLGASLGTSLDDSLSQLLAEGLADKAQVQPVKRPMWSQFGALESYWIAHYLFARDVIGVQYEEAASRKLDLMADLCRNVGMWWPYEGVVFVSERPTVRWNDDERPQIHATDGPAVAFPDGFSIHAIDGHVVPEYVVERPEEITVERVKAETSAEVRRIMIERYVGGPGQYLADIDATVIDTDSSPTDSRYEDAPHLLRALIAAGDDLYLVGTDGSTRRTYYMPLDPRANIKTCAQAHESIAPFGARETQIVGQG